MTWQTVDRPGQTGLKKQELQKEWDKKYGKGNWRKVHILDGKTLLKPEVFLVCEEAYFEFSVRQPKLWQELLKKAKDIYDVKEEEVESGTDYTKQLGYTRFHDICIRRVVKRRGWKFTGDKLIKIRYEQGKSDFFSEYFDPGKVPFHLPQAIHKPNLEGWWDKDSVEDFYQSNKFLQTKS